MRANEGDENREKRGSNKDPISGLVYYFLE